MTAAAPDMVMLRRLAISAAMVALIGVVASVELDGRHVSQIRTSEVLGLVLTETKVSDELVVDSLRAGGQAQQAGIRVGDIVERIDGRPVLSQRDADRDMAAEGPIDLLVRRGTNKIDVVIARGQGGSIGQ